MYRIAFFGSDAFSLASFKAVHRLLQTKPQVVSGLELCVRKLKPSGRGMREVKTPALVTYALENKLKWHEIETNLDFQNLVDANFNLAVAVSYGNLIPSFFLRSMHFGGLNVHPSLLPAYRGSSPVQAAIRNQETRSGVSIQTLHPYKFDHGDILKQTEVAIDARETTHSLLARLGSIGASDLCDVLENINIENYTALHPSYKSSLAPKQNSSARIDPAQPWESVDALGRALGKLYFMQSCRNKPVRVNVTNFYVVDRVCNVSPVPGIDLGYSADNVPLLAIKTANGYFGAARVTVQNYKEENPESYFQRLHSRKLGEIIHND